MYFRSGRIVSLAHYIASQVKSKHDIIAGYRGRVSKLLVANETQPTPWPYQYTEMLFYGGRVVNMAGEILRNVKRFMRNGMTLELNN